MTMLTTLLRDRLVSWTNWLCVDRWLIGSSLARIGFGTIVTAFLLVSIPVHRFILFDTGMMSNSDFSKGIAPIWGPNIFALSTNMQIEQVIFVTAIVICAAYTAGLFSRLTAILFAIVTWSVFHRSPAIIDGGYRLLCILLVYLSVADVGAHWSLDSHFRLRGGASSPYSAMLHNSAVLICLVQLCIVYFFSAFYKIQGESWQQGTALYYAIEGPEFNTAVAAGLLLRSPILIALGTYATLLFQSAFPWLIWNVRLKYSVVAIAIGFHIGIALGMGLYWFSSIMIISEVLIFTDKDYVKLFHRFAQVTSPRKGLAVALADGP